MGVKFKNNAESTLDGNINGSVTTFDVAVGEGNNFPIVTAGATDYFYVTIVDVSGNREIVKVTEHQSGDTFQTVERGADDTSGTSFVTGDKVQLRLPKIVLEAFRDDIVSNTADIATNTAAIAANALLLLAPSGLKMWFYENTPPTGWTIDSGPADSLLAVKGGAQDYNDTGGQVLGSWTPTTHTHTGPSHTHTGPSHTHTMGTHTHTMGTHVHSMPSHVHQWYDYRGATADDYTYNSGGSAVAITGTNNSGYDKIMVHSGTVGGSVVAKMDIDAYTTSVDPGNTNSTDPGDTNATDPGDTNAGGTGATGASGTAATGSGSAPSTDRPYAAVGCIGTKD